MDKKNDSRRKHRFYVKPLGFARAWDMDEDDCDSGKPRGGALIQAVPGLREIMKIAVTIISFTWN